MTQAICTNTFTAAKWIVSSDATQGTHTTIAGAISSASSGDLILIRPGTYTENLTLKNGVSFTSITNSRSGAGGKVNIVGKMIDNGASVVCNFTGIQFKTNSDFIGQLTGSGSNLVFTNCEILGVDNTIFSMNTSSQNIYLYDCDTDIQTTLISLYTITNGTFWSYNCNHLNTGSTVTSGTLSDGSARFFNCQIQMPLATSSTGVLELQYCFFGTLVTPFINQTWVTTAGSVTSFIEHCELYSGTASAISVGAGSTVECYQCTINSSNTNVITGAGTIQYAQIVFSGSSLTINTTTKIPIPLPVLQGGTGLTASGSSGNALVSDGTGFVSSSISSIINSYSVAGTSAWTPNSKTKVVEFYVWAGGGGGGSGRCGATTAASGGGGGGGSGIFYIKTSAAALTSAPYTITVGAGGTGGISVNAVLTNGNPGLPGNNSSVGTVIVATAANSAGFGGTTSSGGGGSGSTLFNPQGSLALSGTGSTGVGGSGTTTTFACGSGGGGGAGYTAATPRLGGAGAAIQDTLASVILTGGTAGANTGGDGGDGNSAASLPYLFVSGTGGGGGGMDGTTTSGKGGNGANCCGGGGGAGNLSSNPSGAGGNGGDGRVIIIEYF